MNDLLEASPRFPSPFHWPLRGPFLLFTLSWFSAEFPRNCIQCRGSLPVVLCDSRHELSPLRPSQYPFFQLGQNAFLSFASSQAGRGLRSVPEWPFSPPLPFFPGPQARPTPRSGFHFPPFLRGPPETPTLRDR